MNEKEKKKKREGNGALIHPPTPHFSIPFPFLFFFFLFPPRRAEESIRHRVSPLYLYHSNVMDIFMARIYVRYFLFDVLGGGRFGGRYEGWNWGDGMDGMGCIWKE